MERSWRGAPGRGWCGIFYFKAINSSKHKIGPKMCLQHVRALFLWHQKNCSKISIFECSQNCFFRKFAEKDHFCKHPQLCQNDTFWAVRDWGIGIAWEGEHGIFKSNIYLFHRGKNNRKRLDFEPLSAYLGSTFQPMDEFCNIYADLPFFLPSQTVGGEAYYLVAEVVLLFGG